MTRTHFAAGAQMPETFDILFLIARPAAGKSEIIDFLKMQSPVERAAHYHLGALREFDDFPMIWTWFEEDDLLTRMGHPRLHTDQNGYFLGQHLWDLLIERLALDYTKLVRNEPDFHQRGGTALIEFSRGAEHGGFQRAFAHLPARLLSRSAVLYVSVSWEESLRKNRARFNPDRPDSILEHALPDEKLARLYGDSDWEALTASDPQFLTFQGVRVPYAVLPNEDDVTSQRGPALAERLAGVLQQLHKCYQVRATDTSHSDSGFELP
jgi:hypothetical protein